jgi:RNA polymerase sigma factor (sigma-70 family)
MPTRFLGALAPALLLITSAALAAENTRLPDTILTRRGALSVEQAYLPGVVQAELGAIPASRFGVTPDRLQSAHQAMAIAARTRLLLHLNQRGAAALVPIGDSEAVSTFVDRYRPALLRFIRGQGIAASDAEDLAQEVLLRLFAKGALARADQERGRFRAFIVGITKNVILKDRAHRSAQKRGGGVQPIPLDEVSGLAAPEPDAEFDRIWAEQLLFRAFESLERENPRQHETLSLQVRQQLEAKAIATRLKRTIQDVRNDLHRARKRLARIVRDEVVHYASSPEELDDELALFRSFMGLGQ